MVASAFVFCFFLLCWDLRVSSLSGRGHGSEILTGQKELRLNRLGLNDSYLQYKTKHVSSAEGASR